MREPPEQHIPYNIENSLGYLLNKGARLSLADLNQRIKAMNIRPGQIPLIIWLLEEDGLTQSDLCQKANIEQPSVAEMLKKMERDGLITRKRDIKDRRKYRIYLSDGLRRSAHEIYRCARASNERAVVGLEESEIGAFLKTLHRIIDNLRN